MVSADAYRVEQILLQRSLRRPPRPSLRITFREHHVADCATVDEVAQLVDLATLEPGLVVTPPHRHTWPRWPLIEDVIADDFAVENDGRMLVLYPRRDGR